MRLIRTYTLTVSIVTSLMASCQQRQQSESQLAALPYWAVNFEIDASQALPLGTSKSLQLTSYLKNEQGLRVPYSGPVEWKVIQGDAVQLEDNGLVRGVKSGAAVIEAIARDHGLVDQIEIQVEDEDIAIYFQAPKNWQTAHIWYWYLDGDAHPSGRDKYGEPFNAIHAHSLGSWPGPEMQPVPDLDGWYSFSIPTVRNPQFQAVPLKEQPVRIVFNNPILGEKTRDMLHYDGCFLAYNRYLADPAQGFIDGRWDSPNNCRALSKKRRLLAKPPGGPVWDETHVKLDISYGELKELRYTIGTEPSDASNGVKLALAEKTLQIASEDFRDQNELVLCVHAKDEQDQTYQECYSYNLESEVKFKKMGVDYSPEETTFSIWSPDRRDLVLWLEGQHIPMGYIGDAIAIPGTYAVTVPGDHHLKRYHFLLDGQVVRDPYAIMAVPGSDYNVIVDVSNIEPEGGWAAIPELKAAEDSIIYEMSIRDFTSDASSGVRKELRGKFLGSVEAGTYLNKGQNGADPAIKTGLDHLIEMGVTHVQLLPIVDYATCSAKDPDNSPDCYNWGYDPENWSVPEERYATDPYDYVGRVRELQTMVNEFHKAGIRVIMDVVYNHTWVRPFRESDEGEKYLGDISGQYFLMDEDGFGYQLTGTGNTIDPTHPMVERLILDSLIHWVEVYGIDGFRFDLAGVFDYQKIEGWMQALEERFPERSLIAYGEPWTALYDPSSDHFRLHHLSKMKDAKGQPLEFGGFNFSFREAIKGFNDNGGGGGFAFNQIPNPELIINGLRGSIGQARVELSSFSSDPAQSINYVSSHDNLTMFDKILAWSSLQNWTIPFDYQKRISGFANSIVLFSQGIPMIHSGAEMLRSKNGIHNSYRAPDAINKIDWQRKKAYFDVYSHYRAAIQVRKEFPGFRLETAEDIHESVRVRFLGNGLFELRIAPSRRSSRELLVYLNSGPNQHVSLPSGRWQVRMHDTRLQDGQTAEGSFLVSGTAATVLYR